MLSVNYAECPKQAHYAECHYAECRGAKKDPYTCMCTSTTYLHQLNTCLRMVERIENGWVFIF
jgi:hypothetical protein